MYPTSQMEKHNSEAKLRRRFERGIQEVLLSFCETLQKKMLGIDRRTSVNISGSTGVGRGLIMYNVYIKLYLRFTWCKPSLETRSWKPTRSDNGVAWWGC